MADLPPPPDHHQRIPAPMCEITDCLEVAQNSIRMSDGSIRHRCPEHTSKFHTIIAGPGPA